MKLAMKVLGIAMNVVLVLVILLGGFMAFTSRRSPDGIPTVKGRKVLSVISGSMEPTIHTGDVIIVKPLGPGEEVRDQDIITFRSKEKPDMLITHRVVGTVLIDGKPAAFVTKGDANQSSDLGVVSKDQLVGRYQWRIPYFGYISAFLRKPAGIVLFVILPGVIIIGMEFRKMYLTLTEAEAAEKAAKEAEATAEGGDRKAE